MIVFLTLLYAGFLAILIRVRILPNSAMVWLSTFGWMVLLLIVLFVPMQWGAPSGPVRLFTQTIQIIPNVAGEVIEVPVEANEPLHAGDVLFKIDPVPFEATLALRRATLRRVVAVVEQDVESEISAQAQLDAAQAQQSLAQIRLENDRKLLASGTVSQIQFETRKRNLDTAEADVDRTQSALAVARAELGALMSDGTPAKLAEVQAQVALAEWELEQTIARAPSNGFVTYNALGVGQRVTTLPLQPAMGFITTSNPVLVAEINQIHLRYVRPGQPVEIALKSMPGEVVTGEVERVLNVNATAQATNSGTLPSAGSIVAEPFFVRIKLREDLLAELRPGTVGNVAIYTDQVAATHVIRKVMIRMDAIMNYILPGL